MIDAPLDALIRLSPRSKDLRAPLWVAQALDGARLLGQGSYASVFGCQDGLALKITRDPATQALARRLQGRRLGGFAPVLRAGMLERRRQPRMAVAMPTLTALPPMWRREIRLIYGQALLAAARRQGSHASTVRGAKAWACRLACKSPQPQSDFSASLCEELARLCLPSPAGRSLRVALLALARFCQEFGCDVDLMSADNWMLDRRGNLRLSDPVARKAYAF